MPPARTFSFEEHDEQSISHPQQRYQQHYHDNSAREIISSPQYRPTTPPEPPSPVSLSHARPYTTHDPRVSIEGPYTDRSPSPPPPPPHRASPDKYSRGDSALQRPVAARSIAMDDYAQPLYDEQSRSRAPSERLYTPRSQERHVPNAIGNTAAMPGPYMQRPSPNMREHSSYGSNIPLAPGAATPGSITPSAASDMRSSKFSGRSIPLEEYPPTHPYRSSQYSYHDSPYHNSSHNVDATVSNASINPQNIADDGDDDFAPYPRSNQPRSAYQQQGINKSGAVATVGTAAASGGLMSGLFGRKNQAQTASGSYQPVDSAGEKNNWLAQENRKRKRNGWICGIAIGVVIIIAIIAGIVGGVMSTHSYKAGSGSINNANDDTNQNGDLDLNSAEIKKLMKNSNLHKVFPGMDYTPWGVQYPLCEKYPPSQNNVTRDMAVLSQLTNTIRLYGTDCNQTEMVLHAIDRLKLKNIKIWLGVWIDTNTTTTQRQISKMYTILNDVKDKSIFKGVIVGNEALYRAGEEKAQSKQELIQILKDVKTNFTSLGYTLPIATSDLGDNWDSDLVQAVDYVMSNIHPFFAGVSADKAAAWTWNFWNEHDVALTASLPNVKQVISETGWPSGGGTDCGGTDGNCAAGQSGAVASVDSMNTFMENWVCQALANGTDYFWFEAFDEPWKVQYNTAGKEWEDKWGLMDAARNLKSGVKIPNCGGKTVS